MAFPFQPVKLSAPDTAVLSVRMGIFVSILIISFLRFVLLIRLPVIYLGWQIFSTCAVAIHRWNIFEREYKLRRVRCSLQPL